VFPCFFHVCFCAHPWNAAFLWVRCLYQLFYAEAKQTFLNGSADKEKGVNTVAKKEILDKLSIYIPQKKMEDRPVERLIRLGEKRDRSINYLVVDAIIQYLEREEKKA